MRQLMSITMKTKLLPKQVRRSALKAIAGVVVMLSPFAAIVLGYDPLGIIAIILIVIGAGMMRDYFREIGLSS